MKIQFKKISNTHHELVVIRNDASSDSVNLETKSYLKHDLIHLAIEQVAGLSFGFWGLLASGKTINDLNSTQIMMKKGQIPKSDLEILEVIVGALTGYIDHNIEVEKVIEGLENIMQAYENEMPKYVTKEIFVNAKERFQELSGHWKSTAFDEVMEIEW